LSSLLPDGWKKLDENLIGEFGLREILKQFLGDTRAGALRLRGPATAMPSSSTKRASRCSWWSACAWEAPRTLLASSVTTARRWSSSTTSGARCSGGL